MRECKLRFVHHVNNTHNIDHEMQRCSQAVRIEQASIKRDIKQRNRRSQQEIANNLKEELPVRLTRAMELASKKELLFG